MKLRVAPAALEDLQDIDDYSIKIWGVEQADRYLAMLWTTFEQLMQTPEKWRLRPELHPDCRICFAGRHAILFRVKDGVLEVARVLHEAMDYPRHVDELFGAE